MAFGKGAELDWDKLRVFHEVAKAGSLTHAAEVLHLSQSAVSRQISALEASLKLSLFHRHARGLLLTEHGEQLFETVKDVFGKLQSVEGQLREAKGFPAGALRINAPIGLGSVWLAPVLHEFKTEHPAVDVRLILTDSDLDLAMRQADVALRVSEPMQADLVRLPLFHVNMHIYASRGYLELRGRPDQESDLDDHDLIVFGDDFPTSVPGLNWLMRVGKDKQEHRKPKLAINNVMAMKAAVVAGAGLAVLPDYLVRATDGLERLLTDLDAPHFQTYFAYPEELRSSPKVVAFRDFLRAKMKGVEMLA